MKLNQLINKYPAIEQTDIILLLEKVLDNSYSRLLLLDEIHLSEKQTADLDDYIKRLQSNEPIQYILGTWDFIDINLLVDKRALIPRPETEILALETLDLAKKIVNPKIIDIGCGTGCIGLYIKHMLPDANVTLCDISKDAIDLAKENAKRLNLDVEFLLLDMKDIEGSYDIIVSNPPYIPAEDMKQLDKSVVNFEPENALYGGTDGLDFYRLLSVMHKNVANCGYLAVEIGIHQAEDVKKLLEKNFEEIIIKNDFANIPRVVIGQKKNNTN
ncbi:MAG: peptide chain release factor N(5)-glutamine methyltransferase [Eubacteriales bacterium]